MNCVDLFLRNSHVNFNLETKEKQTAMHLACGVGNIEIFRALLVARISLDACDRHNRTPIMMAIRNHNN